MAFDAISEILSSASSVVENFGPIFEVPLRGRVVRRLQTAAPWGADPK